MARYLTPAETAERRRLYEEGGSDRQIADIQGVHVSVIGDWRRRQKLPVNASPREAISPEDDALRRSHYDAGWTDRKIAARLGIAAHSVLTWRRVRKLPPNGVKSLPPSQAAKARRMLMYQLGWSDTRIGRAEGRHPNRIFKWRKKRNLPAITQREAPGLEVVFARVRRAVGRGLPPDVVDDAVMDMCAALLDGTIPLAEIEAHARRYGNRVLDQFASKFGPRSLDAELGDSEGFTLLDTMADERSSSWLEEMGATVW